MDVAKLSPSQRRLYNLAFGGMLFGLPAVVWYATIAMVHYDGALVVPDAAFIGKIAAPTVESVGFYFAWLVLQALLMLFAPGRTAHGVPTASGDKLPYKLNGLAAVVLTGLLVAGLVVGDVIAPTLLYDQIGPLVTTTNIVVMLLCVYIHFLGRSQATDQERERNPLEAYVVGAALNPRNGSFDWKFFCESRPGMILWILLNLSFAAAQYRTYGSVSTSMMLVVGFQALYVIDYFVVEEAILTTWDIRHEPFGFMLGWGSLVWVPFTFSLQGLYLVQHSFEMPLWGIVGLVVLNMTGYVIFRTSNLQKHHFRRDPKQPIWGKEPEFIQTEHGSKLLVSGWWGVARHLNYTGDLMMGLAWCLTCGASRVLTFFYFIYFIILLVHRERRDHDHCAEKYGADWERYTAKVRWRMLPGVY
jgi:protein-S-isoprenylcysteine O-methyltransferase Ste14